MFIGGTCVGEEGRKRRIGFGKKGKTSFTVHRSEEVLPEDTKSDTTNLAKTGKQASLASSDGEGSVDGERSALLISIETKKNYFFYFIFLDSLFFYDKK